MEEERTRIQDEIDSKDKTEHAADLAMDEQAHKDEMAAKDAEDAAKQAAKEAENLKKEAENADE
jgi:hypothetical protein